MDPARTDLTRYAGAFDDSSFSSKIRSVARRAGAELLHKALYLYEVMKDPATPLGTKTKIVAALGYFISPIDAMPDFIPIVGLTDDLAVLVYIAKQVKDHVTERHIASATAAVRRLVPGFRGGELGEQP